MNQIILNGFLEGSSIAVLAVAFGIFYKTTKIFHFAFGAVYAFAAFMMYFTGNIIIAIICTILLSLLIESFIYYPLSRKNVSLSVTLISSIGVYIVLINILALLFGNEVKLLTNGLHSSNNIYGLYITNSQILLFSIPLIACIITIVAINHTKTGKLLYSIGDNFSLSKVMGLNIRFYRIVAISICTGLSSLVAIYKGLDVGIDPYIGLTAVLTAAVAFIVSGGEKYYAMIIAGFLIGVIRNVSVWYISAQWMEAVTFVILISFLIYKNKGVISKQIRLEEI